MYVEPGEGRSGALPECGEQGDIKKGQWIEFGLGLKGEESSITRSCQLSDLRNWVCGLTFL